MICHFRISIQCQIDFLQRYLDFLCTYAFSRCKSYYLFHNVMPLIPIFSRCKSSSFLLDVNPSISFLPDINPPIRFFRCKSSHPFSRYKSSGTFSSRCKYSYSFFSVCKSFYLFFQMKIFLYVFPDVNHSICFCPDVNPSTHFVQM